MQPAYLRCLQRYSCMLDHFPSAHMTPKLCNVCPLAGISSPKGNPMPNIIFGVLSQTKMIMKWPCKLGDCLVFRQGAKHSSTEPVISPLFWQKSPSAKKAKLNIVLMLAKKQPCISPKWNDLHPAILGWVCPAGSIHRVISSLKSQ